MCKESSWDCSTSSINTDIEKLYLFQPCGRDSSVLRQEGRVSSAASGTLGENKDALENLKVDLSNTQELSILEVVSTPGSVCCWILLSCLEVLVTCARYSDAGGQQVNQYCLYTAGLWAYARDKLLELVNLCGLMPKQTQSRYCGAKGVL